jgi:hypothetical protein
VKIAKNGDDIGVEGVPRARPQKTKKLRCAQKKKKKNLSRAAGVWSVGKIIRRTLH